MQLAEKSVARTSHVQGKASLKALVILSICLLAIFCVLFNKSFDPNHVLFANDLPLGALKAEQSSLPGTFFGNWQAGNWIGGESVSAAPDFSALLGSVFPPEVFLKLYAPITMLLLGLSAWLCLRELGLGSVVCILGGLAAGLNMHAFSIACWGLGPWVISWAMMFLAIAALVSKSITHGWIRGVLAGAAVGLGLMEGFDVGAIDSLYIGIFGLFAGLVSEKISSRIVIKSVSVVAIVAVFSAFTAAHTISTLVGTQVKGIVGMEQDEKSKEKRWIEVTQWSLPKTELLRVLIPGVFGYRMVDGKSQLYEKSYWGAVAQTPGYEQHHQGLSRHSGSGEYAGIFILFVAILAIAQSFRKQNGPFSDRERKMIWFWAGAALISLLLALGRHAPFYRLFYAIPYASTIRNPIKFMHPFHIALLILFGFGLESLVRRYLDAAKTVGTKTGSLIMGAFEKKWAVSTLFALGAAVLGWMVYVGSEKKIIAHLVQFDFPTEIAPAIAKFSIGEAGWFVLFLASSIILLLTILRGKFQGKLKLASVLMGGLIVLDLAHADIHWIVYDNYKEKYTSNPVIDSLREKPYEQRVMVLPFQVNDAFTFFQRNVYYTEWLQHHFLYYNIQMLDIAQEPRVAADNAAYREAFQKGGAAGLLRMWQLTNVRYFFGLANGFVDSINQQLDAEQKRFKLFMTFGIARANQGEQYQVQTNSTGPFALIEFTGALPRAKLYSNWQVITNDTRALEELARPEFDPLKTVVVSQPLSTSRTTSTNSSPGSVQIASYHPKEIQLNAKVESPAVLLFNEKFDAKWKIFVDGTEKPLLRCNYIMRGVQLDPGDHNIEFRFKPPLDTLYISLAALGVALGLCAFVAFGGKQKKPNGSNE